MRPPPVWNSRRRPKALTKNSKLKIKNKKQEGTKAGTIFCVLPHRKRTQSAFLTQSIHFLPLKTTLLQIHSNPEFVVFCTHTPNMPLTPRFNPRFRASNRVFTYVRRTRVRFGYERYFSVYPPQYPLRTQLPFPAEAGQQMRTTAPFRPRRIWRSRETGKTHREEANPNRSLALYYSTNFPL